MEIQTNIKFEPIEIDSEELNRSVIYEASSKMSFQNMTDDVVIKEEPPVEFLLLLLNDQEEFFNIMPIKVEDSIEAIN
jgi:hypothetical protein